MERREWGMEGCVGMNGHGQRERGTWEAPMEHSGMESEEGKGSCRKDGENLRARVGERSVNNEELAPRCGLTSSSCCHCDPL